MENSNGQDNLALWKQVHETDPSYTKTVDMRGGFTAIDPTYQLKEATRAWGPYGKAWGLKDCQFERFEVGGKQALLLEAVFFAPDISFPIAVDIPYRVNDDSYKKAMTSARSKALAMLGFNADVFLGQYDDNHYVGEMRTKFADESKLRDTVLSKIRTSDTPEKLEHCRNRLDELRGNGSINITLYSEGLQLLEQQESEVTNGVV